jgi:hypothetical protein
MSGDAGLAQIAKHFGKEEAVKVWREASATEEAGDIEAAIKLYRRAFKMWDALDSTFDENGLPLKVRAEAEEAGIDCARFLGSEMDVEPPPRFSVDQKGQWLAHLKEHGYCVLADVADTQAIEKAMSLLWDFLEDIPQTEVKRDDASTWETSLTSPGGDIILLRNWIPSQANGIIGSHGFGQSAFSWHTRQLPKVKDAFAVIWDECGNVFRPWSRRPEWRTDGGWWHVDQNFFLPGKDGRVCVQGLVTYTDATPATGGLCVIPGSHKQHKEICERSRADKLMKDFVLVQPGDPVLESGGRLVCAKRGDLLLWDSRCVHCNTPGVKHDGEALSMDVDRLLRVVGYVCMTPASWASAEILDQRKHAYLNNETVDHWPHEFHGTCATCLWPPPKSWHATSEEHKRMIIGDIATLLSEVAGDSCETDTILSPGIQDDVDMERFRVIGSPTSDSMSSFKELDAYLALHSFLGSSDSATAVDYNRCGAIAAADLNASRFPHLYRWHSHISHLLAKFGLFDMWGSRIEDVQVAN